MDARRTTALAVSNGWPAARYAWYVVAVLTAAYTLSYIDRQILGLLLEPIRQDLQLSDTQVSLLVGTAFALFYVTLGLPLGWLADRANRRNVMFIGVLLWSLMTAACGLASNFWQLFAARMGVGVGEAALSPAAWSTIADYFPPERRVRPAATYNLALAVGTGLAFIAGGAINAALIGLPELDLPLVGRLEAWQTTFLALGIPGMFFALVVLTIREPQRRGVLAAASASRVPMRDAVRFIWNDHRKTFAAILFAYAGFAIHSVTVTLWMPTLFMRRFGWTTAQVGLTLGPILLVSCTAGVLVAMWLATWLRRRGSTGALFLTSLIGGVILTPLGIALPLVDDPVTALVLLAPVSALSFGIFAVVPPLLQLITPNQIRGQVAAIFSFFNNVLGLMVGATYVALITDFVLGDPARLHHSLAIVAATVLPVSCLLTWWGLPHLRHSMESAESWLRNA